MTRRKTYDPGPNAAYEVTLRYLELGRLERPALAALLAWRLESAAIRRDRKANLVKAALTAEFGAARMADWKEGPVAARATSAQILAA